MDFKTIFQNSKIQFTTFLIILIGITLYMMYSYTSECYMMTHDYYFHFQRFSSLIEAIKDFSFPIYIDYDALQHYGYLVKFFYSDFVFIPFALIGIVTTPLFAFQVMLFTMTVLCGVFMYMTVKIIYQSSSAATISAILYTFCQYKLFDLYQRGAIAEAFSFTFLPIVFLGLYYILKGDYKKWYVITIGFSLMIFTHLLSTVMLGVTVAIVCLIYYRSFVKEPVRLKYLLLAALATIIISTYYLLPMIEQMLSNTFYYETRISMLPEWRRLPREDLIGGMFSGFVFPRKVYLPGIGLLLTIGVFTRLFVIGKSDKLKSVDIGVLIGLFYIFATCVYFPWDKFPFNLLSFIQFPWRWFEFTSFFFALATGYYISESLKSEKRKYAAIILVIAATLLLIRSDSGIYQKIICNPPPPQKTEDLSAYFIYRMGALEYLPDKMDTPEHILEKGDSISYNNIETSIRNLQRSKTTTLDVSVFRPDILELPLVYYKGYKAYLNEKEITISQSDNGLIEIPVNESGSVKVYYAGTVIQRASWYITIVAIIALGIYIFLVKRKRKNEDTDQG